jgi:hypothetical protein
MIIIKIILAILWNIMYFLNVIPSTNIAYIIVTLNGYDSTLSTSIVDFMSVFLYEIIEIHKLLWRRYQWMCNWERFLSAELP